MILKTGHNCWIIEKATRASVIIDASDYFEAVAQAVEKAQERVMILGWDLDTRIRLRHRPDFPPLGDFLKEQLALKPNLHIYVLIWDFAFIYISERQYRSQLINDLSGSERLHFSFDDDHPLWASHHQKVVVVDDQLGFVGGLDLTQKRWDTANHASVNHDRVDPDGIEYGPFHDVQLVVTGDASKKLGELANTRWERATAEKLQSLDLLNEEIWPQNLKTDFENQNWAVARTDPEYGDRREIRENEALFIDSINGAQHYIYIENQYFTSERIAQAFIEKLKGPGPEIVLIVPCENTGWFEAGTMRVLRSKLLRQVRAADKNGRLRVFFPVTGAQSKEVINLHSKVFICDDRFLRIGSSNLNDRSTGVDTECDLALETQDLKAQSKIREVRDRLLAEHLGVSLDKIQNLSKEKSLNSLIDYFNRDTQRLQNCPDDTPWVIDKMSWVAKIWDLPRPYKVSRKALAYLFLALLSGSLIFGWNYFSVGQWANPHELARWGQALEQKSFGPVLILLGIAFLGTMMIAVTIVALAASLIFSPLMAILYVWAGFLLSCCVLYFIGRTYGHRLATRFSSPKIIRAKDYIRKHGVITIALARLLPVVPHWALNLVLGAYEISFPAFFVGIALGLIPEIALICIFGDEVTKFIYELQTAQIIEIGLCVLILLVVTFFIRKNWRRRRVAS